MDYNEIRILSDKYLAGETSLEEEKLLQNYLTQGNVHADFEDIRKMMGYFSTEAGMKTSEGFEEKILSKISESKAPAKTFKLYWLKIAAAIVLIAGITGIIYTSLKKPDSADIQSIARLPQQPPGNTVEITDTYNNPEDAKKAVEQALALLSRHLDKGRNVAERNIGKIDVLNKALDN